MAVRINCVFMVTACAVYLVFVCHAGSAVLEEDLFAKGIITITTPSPVVPGGFKNKMKE